MLRCQRLHVKSYDFTLGRLAYENLLPVLNPGNILFAMRFFKMTPQIFNMARGIYAGGTDPAACQNPLAFFSTPIPSGQSQ